MTGEIYNAISETQDILIYYEEYSQEIIDNLHYITLDNVPNDLYNFYVLNGKLSRYTDIELVEIKEYKKVLTDSERTLNKLKPSYDEIKKAEETLKLLELLQEVM